MKSKIQKLCLEVAFLRKQLDEITGETDYQAEQLGQAENTLSRIEHILDHTNPALD